MPYYNVLQAKTAVASASSTLTNFVPRFAIDGSSSVLTNANRWVSLGGKAGEWLQVDLGALVRVNSFRMVSGNTPDGVNMTYAIKDADFQVWQNDAWVTVGSFRGKRDFEGIQTVTLDKFYKTDKIRVYFPIDSPDTNYRIYELEAYGRIIGKKAKGTTSKNLLPSFTHPGWNYTRPIVSMSPSKVVIDLDQSRTNEFVIPAKPNTTYTLSGKTDGRVYFVQRTGSSYQNDKTGTGYSNYGEFSRTITTGSDVTGLRVSLTSDDAGNKSYENIMLNEGATALPYQVYEQNMRQAILRPMKNMLRDIESIDTSSLWTKEINTGVDIVKTGEKFQGATVYRMTFKSTTNARVYQLFSELGTYSASIWFKFIQYDTSLLMMIREKNMGVVYGNASMNVNIPDWQQVKLENIKPTNDFVFGLYKSAVTTSKDIIVDVAMPQLEKGSVATPFAKYRGTNKGAVKVPKKNIVDLSASAWENGSISSNGNQFSSTTSLRSSNVIPVKPNGTYTLTVLNTASKIVVSYYDTNKNFVSTPNTFYRDAKTFTVPANCPFMKIVLMNDDSTIPIVPADVAVKNKIQIEEGSVQSPFEMYRLTNKQAVLTQPKKNLLKGFKSGAWTFSAQATVVDDTTFTLNGNAPYLGSFQTFDVEPNTTYVLSFEYSSVPTARAVTPIIMGYNFTTLVGTLYNQSAPPSPASCVFTTPANCNRVKVGIQNSNNTDAVFTFKKAQVEKGSVATPFAPYALQAKTAKY